MLCVQSMHGRGIHLGQNAPRFEVTLCFAPWLTKCSKSGPLVPPGSRWEVLHLDPRCRAEGPQRATAMPIPCPRMKTALGPGTHLLADRAGLGLCSRGLASSPGPPARAQPLLGGPLLTFTSRGEPAEDAQSVPVTKVAWQRQGLSSEPC